MGIWFHVSKYFNFLTFSKRTLRCVAKEWRILRCDKKQNTVSVFIIEKLNTAL
jgi:hypothetical protein